MEAGVGTINCCTGFVTVSRDLVKPGEKSFQQPRLDHIVAAARDVLLAVELRGQAPQNALLTSAEESGS
jgi:hypothetical protein